MDAITKTSVRAWAEARDFDALLTAFDADPDRVRRYLTRLAFHPDDPVHEAVMDAFTMLASARQEGLDEFWRETIHRQLWAMNEEGGNVAWSAPELIGAVIAGAPDAYGMYFSYAVMAAIEEPTFQPSLLAAAARVRAVAPAIVEGFKEDLAALRKRLTA